MGSRRADFRFTGARVLRHKLKLNGKPRRKLMQKLKQRLVPLHKLRLKGKPMCKPMQKLKPRPVLRHKLVSQYKSLSRGLCLGTSLS